MKGVTKRKALRFMTVALAIAIIFFVGIKGIIFGAIMFALGFAYASF